MLVRGRDRNRVAVANSCNVQPHGVERSEVRVRKEGQTRIGRVRGVGRTIDGEEGRLVGGVWRVDWTRMKGDKWLQRVQFLDVEVALSVSRLGTNQPLP